MLSVSSWWRKPFYPGLDGAWSSRAWDGEILEQPEGRTTGASLCLDPCRTCTAVWPRVAPVSSTCKMGPGCAYGIGRCKDAGGVRIALSGWVLGPGPLQDCLSFCSSELLSLLPLPTSVLPVANPCGSSGHLFMESPVRG